MTTGISAPAASGQCSAQALYARVSEGELAHCLTHPAHSYTYGVGMKLVGLLLGACAWVIETQRRSLLYPPVHRRFSAATALALSAKAWMSFDSKKQAKLRQLTRIHKAPLYEGLLALTKKQASLASRVRSHVNDISTVAKKPDLDKAHQYCRKGDQVVWLASLDTVLNAIENLKEVSAAHCHQVSTLVNDVASSVCRCEDPVEIDGEEHCSTSKDTLIAFQERLLKHDGALEDLQQRSDEIVKMQTKLENLWSEILTSCKKSKTISV